MWIKPPNSKKQVSEHVGKRGISSQKYMKCISKNTSFSENQFLLKLHIHPILVEVNQFCLCSKKAHGSVSSFVWRLARETVKKTQRLKSKGWRTWVKSYIKKNLYYLEKFSVRLKRNDGFSRNGCW